MSILRRTVTIIIVAPTVLKIIQTWYGTIFLCWFLHFVAMIEWTGLKRHLKLCLLDPLIHSQRKRLQDLQRFKATLSLTSKKKEDDDEEEQEQSTMRKRRASSSSKTTPKRNTSGSSSPSNKKKKTATTTTLDDSSPSLGLFGEPEEEDLVVLEGLDPWTDREFPTPVAPVNLFILLKCLACSLIVPLAFFSPEHFLLMLSLYFFFWVVLTLLDRNRSEMKQDVARRIIQEKDAAKNQQNNNNNKQASSPSGNYKTRSQQRFEQATKPLPDANEFALRELEIVSCYPNVETFINFSIEYFGFVWISNMGFGPMIFQLGEQGQAALAACLFANWANDAGALAAGKTIKGLFGEHATRPLYPRISPSKSLEGAVFGILCNALFASLSPYALPALRDNFHNKEAVPKYFFIVGLMLGVLGVIGDLLQSLFKRVSRIKDTGTFFPGHGGVLDRIDGFVTTLPIVYWMVWALQKGYFDPLLDPNYKA